MKTNSIVTNCFNVIKTAIFSVMVFVLLTSASMSNGPVTSGTTATPPKTIPFEFTEFYTSTYDKTNTTVYVGEVGSVLFKTILDASEDVLANNKKTLTLDLHSPGGSVFFLQLISIQLDILKDAGVKVTTRIQNGNMCASACPAIFIQGDFRSAHKHSVIMLHSPYVRGMDKMSEAEKIYHNKSLDETRKDYIKMFDNVCGKNNLFISNAVNNMKDNFYYTSAVVKGCKKFYTSLNEDAYPIYLPAYGITTRTVSVEN